jgi:hypothetical protein
VDPANPEDPVLSELSRHTLMVWIKGDEAHTEKLIRRFDRAPKPMSYQPEFLTRVWEDYLAQNTLTDDAVDPDTFIRWTYSQALAHRQPRYQAMAENWGITVTADQISAVRSAESFDDLIATTLDAR